MSGRESQTIVVTGASSGIGREIAVQLAAPDREIWLLGRDRQRLEEVAAMVRARGAEAKCVELDLYDLESVEEFLNLSLPSGKRVDWLYLVAAITAFGEVKDMLPEDWERIYRVNLLSPLQMINHCYSNMVRAGGGNIVMISSLAAYAGYPTATAYATMKAGLLGLYRSLHYEGRSHGVSIYHASLGYVGTSIYRSAIYRNTDYAKTMDSIRRLGFRFLSAEEAARRVIGKVGTGKGEFAVPGYAAAMRWVAPRMPFVMGLVHRRIMAIFRETS